MARLIDERFEQRLFAAGAELRVVQPDLPRRAADGDVVALQLDLAGDADAICAAAAEDRARSVRDPEGQAAVRRGAGVHLRAWAQPEPRRWGHRVRRFDSAGPADVSNRLS